jgi:hypothetical protein|tara:strand:+ start:1693 stop:1938 length:246 start_codon:yes stop_codon:yes gene_type:complete
MKTALVVGVRDDQTREVICCGAGAVESRQMVVDATVPGSDAAKSGYESVELHMINRATRAKACRVNKDKVPEKKPKSKAKE